MIKQAVTFLLYNCSFSIGNIITFQVIGKPTGSDRASFFSNLFLAHKEANWVKAQCKLDKINVRKISNFFRLNNELRSLNNDSTFEKHYNVIYPAALELK